MTGGSEVIIYPGVRAARGVDGALASYEEACRSVALAKTVDAAKDIADRAEAVRVYARQAGNRQLEIDAAEIRIRAERRLGEVIAAMREAGELRGPGDRNRKCSDEEHLPPRLSDLGIDRKLSARAQDLAGLAEDFEPLLGSWRERCEREGDRVTVNLLKAAKEPRRENDFYPTPNAIVAEICRRWRPKAAAVWEPFAGDGRFADALRAAGLEVVRGDIAEGQDFFAAESAPAPALCSNPPFNRVREAIDHAFAVGVEEMCLVLPERLWACGAGAEQFARARPSVWANLAWREDYLDRGGSPDRALAVAIWESSCADACRFEVWSRDSETKGGTQ